MILLLNYCFGAISFSAAIRRHEFIIELVISRESEASMAGSFACLCLWVERTRIGKVWNEESRECAMSVR